MKIQFSYDGGHTFRLGTDGFGLDRAGDVAGMFSSMSNERIVAAQ